MNHSEKVLKVKIRWKVDILGFKVDVAKTANREIVKETYVNF